MTQSEPQQSILTLLDDAPMSLVHYRLWLLSAGGTLLDGFSIFALGVAMPLVVSEMGIGASTVGLIGAAIVLGAVVGAAVGGPAADRFGRKRLMLAGYQSHLAKPFDAAELVLIVAGLAQRT